MSIKITAEIGGVDAVIEWNPESESLQTAIERAGAKKKQK